MSQKSLETKLLDALKINPELKKIANKINGLEKLDKDIEQISFDKYPDAALNGEPYLIANIYLKKTSKFLEDTPLAVKKYLDLHELPNKNYNLVLQSFDPLQFEIQFNKPRGISAKFYHTDI